MSNISKEDIERELIAIINQFLVEGGTPYKSQVNLDASLSKHVGVDSLARAELFERIQRTFNVHIPDKLLAEADTLKDIAHYLQNAKPIIVTTPKKIITVHGEKSSVNPEIANTLIDLLLLYGKKSPNKPHIYFQNEEGLEEVITYGDLYKNAAKVAYRLRELGLKENQTVAIMQPTHPAFFYTFFGILLAGGVPVPIYPPFRAHMIEAYAKTEAKILSNAEVRILVTFEQAEKLSHLLRSFVPSLKHVVTISDLLKEKQVTEFYPARADDFAFIQYTSGSTSDPKGVLLSHRNLLSNIRAYCKGIQVTADDISVSWLPLYHDMGLIGMWLGSLYSGVPLILMTPFTFLNHPERWLWAIHYHRGTISGAPNFAYELCIRKISPEMLEGLDLSCWRIAANGAEKIYPRTLEQFVKKFEPFGFKKQTLLPVYGLAESTVGLCIPPLNRDFRVDHVDRIAFEEQRLATPTDSVQGLDYVSCGLPIEGHEVRIVGEQNETLPERHVGKLQFRGPSSMQGYYHNAKATAAIYHDGWLDSGDLAYMADGEVFITGRFKDLIIRAGRNLYPVEIEELIGSIEDVRRGCVAVFGVTDPKQATEDLVVVAETKEKTADQQEKIKLAINETLSTHLDIVPDDIILVAPQTVPKTSSGKLQRSACKELYLTKKLGKSKRPTWWQVAKLISQSFYNRAKQFFAMSVRALYSLYAFLVFILTFTPVFLVVMFASRDFGAKLCRQWARLIMRLVLCPVRVNGLANIPEGPAIYAANHASYLDAMVVLTFLPFSTRFIGKRELLSNPFFRIFMQRLGHLAVDRQTLPKGIEDTKQIEAVLKNGYPIVIFPEGTFGYSSGLRPFRLGAFKMAVETQLPVVPIALCGTRSIMRDDEKLLKPSMINVTVCEPIYPTGKEWKDVTQLRQLVRTEIAKYCGEPSLDFIAAEVVAPRLPK